MDMKSIVNYAYALLDSLVTYHENFLISGELTPAEVGIDESGKPHFRPRTFFRWAAPFVKQDRNLTSYSAPELIANQLFDDGADIWSWVWIVSEWWSGQSFPNLSSLRDWLTSRSSTLNQLLTSLLVSRDQRSKGNYLVSHPLFALYDVTSSSFPIQPILWSPPPTIPALQRYATVTTVVKEAFRRGILPGNPAEDPALLFGYRFSGYQVDSVGRLLLVLLALDEGTPLEEAFDSLSVYNLRMPLWCVHDTLWRQGVLSIKVWAVYPEWQLLSPPEQIQKWIDFLRDEGNSLRQKWGDAYLEPEIEG
jgi:hypothetical protein